MGNYQSSNFMSANMNMVVTVFGFVLSAVFMFIICCRLLCFRIRRGSNLTMLQASRLTSATVDRTSQGLDPSIIATFPTIKYSHQLFISSEDNLCTICLGDYKEKEVLRVLPRCGHAFHVTCIDLWLCQHLTCPICRISLRTFPEWRQLSGQLISLSAKPRFIPGALPETMFEQPNALHNTLAMNSSCNTKDNIGTIGRLAMGLSMETVSCLYAGRAVSSEKKAITEVAESSLSRQQMVDDNSHNLDQEKGDILSDVLDSDGISDKDSPNISDKVGTEETVHIILQT